MTNGNHNPNRANDQDRVVADAFDELTKTVEANSSDGRLLLRRIERMRKARAGGRPWRDILAGETKPGALDLVGRMLNRLSASSGGLRRPLAGELRREGLSIPAVAQMFGVSHQRVSSLLRRDSDDRRASVS
jgi:hypothetical protein